MGNPHLKNTTLAPLNTPVAPCGAKGTALLPLAMASPATMMRATSARCRAVVAVLKVALSRVPSTSSSVSVQHNPKAHLVTP